MQSMKYTNEKECKPYLSKDTLGTTKYTATAKSYTTRKKHCPIQEKSQHSKSQRKHFKTEMRGKESAKDVE